MGDRSKIEKKYNKMSISEALKTAKKVSKHTREKEASHNTNAKWLMDLRADHSNLLEQEPVIITEANILTQEDLHSPRT